MQMTMNEIVPMEMIKGNVGKESLPWESCQLVSHNQLDITFVEQFAGERITTAL